MFIQSIRVPFQTARKCKRCRKGVCIAFFLDFYLDTFYILFTLCIFMFCFFYSIANIFVIFCIQYLVKF